MIGGCVARIVPISGIVTLASASNSSRNASKSSSARSISSISSTAGRGPGCSSARKQRAPDQVFRAEQLLLTERRATRVGQTDAQQLARVVPFIERLGRVDPVRSTAGGSSGVSRTSASDLAASVLPTPASPRAAAAAAGARSGTSTSQVPRRRDSRPRRDPARASRRPGRGGGSRPRPPVTSRGLIEVAAPGRRRRPPIPPAQTAPGSPPACRHRAESSRRIGTSMTAAPSRVEQSPNALASVQVRERRERGRANASGCPRPSS